MKEYVYDYKSIDFAAISKELLKRKIIKIRAYNGKNNKKDVDYNKLTQKEIDLLIENAID